MKPVKTTGAEGTMPGPLDKPLDKPPMQYVASENVAPTIQGAVPFDLPLDNAGDLSKKFAG